MYGYGVYGRLIYGAGLEDLRAESATTLGAVTQVAAGKVVIRGAAAQTLGAVTQTAAGVVVDGNRAAAAQTLCALTQDAPGRVAPGASGARKGVARGFEPVTKVYPKERRPEPYRLPEPPPGWGRPARDFDYAAMLMPTDLAPYAAMRISMLEIEQQIQDAIDIHALEEFLDRQGL